MTFLSAKLSADLVLQADTDAALRPVDLRLTRWKGDQALCPGGTVSLVGAPTDAGATGSLLQLDGAGGCSTGSSSSPVRWGASIALAALATAFGRRALRR